MKRKYVILLVVCLSMAALSYSAWNIYYLLRSEKAKPLIQNYLKEKYHHQFKIVSIQKQYSKDLFKQPVGYRLTLMDTNHITFGNIQLQFNKYQHEWISMNGSDIETEYNKVRKR